MSNDETQIIDASPLALVTGADTLMGQALITSLLAAGWRVAGWGMGDDPHPDLGDNIDAIHGASERFVYQKVDTQWIENIADAIIDLPQLMGEDNLEAMRIDALINLCQASYVRPFEEFEFSQWENVMDLNAKAIIMMSRVCLPFLANRASPMQAGTILNIIGAHAHSPEVHCLATNASKAAALMITQQMAYELAGSHGITAFSISPDADAEAAPGRLCELVCFLLSRKDRHFKLNGQDIRLGA